MTWTHTYREGQIPPGGTITETRPGHQIARAVTEIQERVPHSVDIALGDGLTGGADITNNVLRIAVNLANPLPAPEDDPHRNDPGGAGGDSLPTDADENMVLTYRGGRWVAGYVRAVEL
jgi:hypothetical protein